MEVPPILESKKFQAAALASILAFAATYVGFEPTQVGVVLSPLLAFIGAQAVADFGKERAKLDGGAKTSSSDVTVNVAAQPPTSSTGAILPVLLAGFLCLGLTSCFSPRVDPIALWGPADMAWPAVERDYERGIQDGVEDHELSAASAGVLLQDGATLGKVIDTKDREALMAVPWDAMSHWANRGIQDKLEDGEVGPGVAASLREQLVNFTETIHRLQGL